MIMKNYIYEDDFIYYIRNEKKEIHYKEDYIITNQWFGHGYFLKPTDDKYWETVKSAQIFEKTNEVHKSFFEPTVTSKELKEENIKSIENMLIAKDNFFEKIKNKESKEIKQVGIFKDIALFLYGKEIITVNYPEILYPILTSLELGLEEVGAVEEKSRIAFFYDEETELLHITLLNKNKNSFLAALKPIAYKYSEDLIKIIADDAAKMSKILRNKKMRNYKGVPKW